MQYDGTCEVRVTYSVGHPSQLRSEPAHWNINPNPAIANFRIAHTKEESCTRNHRDGGVPGIIYQGQGSTAIKHLIPNRCTRDKVSMASNVPTGPVKIVSLLEANPTVGIDHGKPDFQFIYLNAPVSHVR